MDLEMESKQYSADFFNSFIENLQNLCQMYLSYEQLVEVTGYISVEMDNSRKERFVLSEILQSTGDVFSESYCSKVFKDFSSETLNLNSSRRVFRQIDQNQGQNERIEISKSPVEEVKGSSEPVYDEDEPEVLAVEMPTKKRRVSQVENQSSDYKENESLLKRSMSGVSDTSFLQQDDAANIGSVSNERPSNERYTADTDSFSAPEPIVQNEIEEGIEYSSSTKTAHREPIRRSWHVTKLEFPSEPKTADLTPSGDVNESQPQTLSQGHRQIATPVVSQAVIETQSMETNQLVISGTSTLSDTQVMCKAEPDAEVSQDILVYTDIDNDDDANPSEDSGESKHSTYGNECSEKDFIMIELDSDDGEDSLGSEPAPCSSSSVQSPSVSSQRSEKRDPSSYSKPQQFAINRLSQFLKLKKIRGPIYSLPPKKLDPILAEFYQRVRKCGGEEFGSRSLKTIQQYLEIYFRSNNYPASITRSPEFEHSRGVMAAKIKQLKSHEDDILTVKREDVQKLYELGLLGDSTPEIIINTLWLMNTVRFNIKGCKRHTDLKWGDIYLKNNNGVESLVLRNSHLYILGSPSKPSRCFVELYKKYWSMRPPDVLDADSPFYLATHEAGFRNYKYGSRIGTVLKRMLLSAGLPQGMKILNYDIL